MGLDEVQQEVETLRYFAEFVDLEDDITAITGDPDDNKFLEAAVAGHVDSIVSGDRHLLDLDTFRGVDIVTPRTSMNASDHPLRMETTSDPLSLCMDMTRIAHRQ